MHIHQGKKIGKHTYTMGGSALTTLASQPYLGVEISDTMDWAPHIHITSRTNKLLGFLRRNLCKCLRNLPSKVYLSLVQPVTAYCSKVWSPPNQV